MEKNKDTIVRREVFLPAGLSLREAGEGEGESRTITGYAILFNTPSAPLWKDDDSDAVEMIAPEAVTRELLDGCDIMMTMFHDRQLILARSKFGEGTLTYDVDDKGVKFTFEAARTADGDKAIELVKRGDLAGCSFAFTTHYYDSDFVERKVNVVNGVSHITYIVKAMTGVYDFTITDCPAYPATSVEARDFVSALKAPEKTEGEEQASEEEIKRMREQWREMRRSAKRAIRIV